MFSSFLTKLNDDFTVRTIPPPPTPHNNTPQTPVLRAQRAFTNWTNPVAALGGPGRVIRAPLRCPGPAIQMSINLRQPLRCSSFSPPDVSSSSSRGGWWGGGVGGWGGWIITGLIHTRSTAAALAGGVHNTWLITAETKPSDCSLANCAHNAKRNFPLSLPFSC